MKVLLLPVLSQNTDNYERKKTFFFFLFILSGGLKYIDPEDKYILSVIKDENNKRSNERCLQKSHEDPLVITADILSHTLGHGLAITTLVGLGDHLELRTLVGDEGSDEISIPSASAINSILDTSGKVDIRLSDASKHSIPEVAASLGLDSVLQTLAVRATVVLVDEKKLLTGVAADDGDVGTLISAKPALTSAVEGLGIGHGTARVAHVWRRTRSGEKSHEHLLVVAAGLRLDGRLERFAVLASIGGSDCRKLVGELSHDIDEDSVVGAGTLHGLVEEISKHLITRLHEEEENTAVVAAGLRLEILEEITADGALVLGNNSHTLLTSAVADDVDEDAIASANTTHGLTQTAGILSSIVHHDRGTSHHGGTHGHGSTHGSSHGSTHGSSHGSSHRSAHGLSRIATRSRIGSGHGLSGIASRKIGSGHGLSGIARLTRRHHAVSGHGRILTRSGLTRITVLRLHLLIKQRELLPEQ